MKKKILYVGIPVIAIAIAAFFIAGSGSNEDQAITVETATVEKQPIIQTVNAVGRIQPKTQVKISADISGKITRLNVKEGQWVEKGDLLAQLDRESYAAAVESAEASLRSYQANVKLAEANMKKAQSDYQRMRDLHAGNLESQANLDAVFAAYQVEKARFESAQEQVEQTRGSLKQARDNLAKTTIYAPMTGTISALNKEAGEIALGSQFQEDVIMVLSDLTGMEALVAVDENDIVSISAGDHAEIEVDALPNMKFSGVVTEIANSAKISGQGSADEKTEFEVKISVEGLALRDSDVVTASNTESRANLGDGSSALRPGMTAGSDIQTDSRTSAVCVPLQCVTLRTLEQLNADEESTYTVDADGFVQLVFIVVDGKVEAREVKTGIQSDSHIEIVEGLGGGEVVVTGSYKSISKDLAPGMAVEVEEDMELAGS